ncbi:MAG: class I SAM-dependent methyltransferase [Rhizomicrobium sp.]
MGNARSISTFLVDEWRFLRGLVQRPRLVGAIVPSSPGLARALAAQIPDGQGPILELGPGTGVVTEAILARGIAPARLTAIEFDADFAQRVAERFPGVRVVTGDAYDLAKTLDGAVSQPFAAIVSSLPLLNETPARRRKLLADAFERLAPGAPFVQFSYGIQPPVAATQRISVRHAALILLNLPPARVWVYRGSEIGSQKSD